MKIFIKVKPSARENRIEKIDEKHYKVSVKAPPIKGRANKMITNLMADHFKVSANQVRIISGFTSSNKMVEIL